MKKKLFWLLAALVATLCLLTVSASAYTVASGNCGANGNNLTWTLDSAGRLNITGTGAMKDYYTSSTTTAPWYSHSDDILQVTIGNGVTSIGDYAFYYCRSLTSVTIPNSVTTIGNDAFRYCSSLTSVTIGNGVTSIGDYAFSGCSSLTSVTIPNSVTHIDNDVRILCK